MKGLELPINILIIIALGIIVLLGVVAMFYPAFFSGSQVVNIDSVKSRACQILSSKFCNEYTHRVTIDNFDANRDTIVGDNLPNSVGFPYANCTPSITNHDNLASLCRCYYQINNETNCKALCGC